ncbi:MAG: hypothetical protein GW946_01050 [Candidatus Pacebacteria bacterium]|nr:hypothetical protein [Candidatus Paceibacterota bacterium]PIR60698.1 MAG: hypothetical protein COU67_01050 [Candidatus Pacebacteria bacterium CG10_big_fil_rev_8_21_14_0_10_44_54]
MRKIYLYTYYGLLGIALFSQVVNVLITESVWVRRNTSFNKAITTQDALISQRKRLENELARISSLTELEQESRLLGYEPINKTIVIANQTKLADTLAVH